MTLRFFPLEIEYRRSRSTRRPARERRRERLHWRPGSDRAGARARGHAGDRFLVDRRGGERQVIGHERATMNTPRTMIPIPASRIGVTASPSRYHAANAFTT